MIPHFTAGFQYWLQHIIIASTRITFEPHDQAMLLIVLQLLKTDA